MSHPRRAALAAAFAATLSSIPRARASDEASTAPDDPLHDPSGASPALVLDVGMAGLTAGGLGAGGLGAVAYPLLTAGFELPLAPTLLLMLDATASVSHTSIDGVVAGGTTSWSLGGDVGLRHILAGPDPVELSWYGAASVSYGESSIDDQPGGSYGWTAGARLGLILQRHFTRWLALRLRTQLLSGGVQTSTLDSPGIPRQVSRHVAVGFDLVPAVALRFAF